MEFNREQQVPCKRMRNLQRSLRAARFLQCQCMNKQHLLEQACPCGSANTYATCCAPHHHGTQPAPTPEALMRSRYSAYVLGLLDYLLRTWHPSTAPGDLELPPTQWLGLQVLHTEQTDNAGVVEFIARYKVNGKAHKLHEVSRFVREPVPTAADEAAPWRYVDGQMIE
jgi:SEC-C motif domain protein